MMKGFAFASFRSEEERDSAMAKIKGAVFKGKTLDVKVLTDIYLMPLLIINYILKY